MKVTADGSACEYPTCTDVQKYGATGLCLPCPASHKAASDRKSCVLGSTAVNLIQQGTGETYPDCQGEQAQTTTTEETGIEECPGYVPPEEPQEEETNQ